MHESIRITHSVDADADAAADAAAILDVEARAEEAA